MSEGASIALCLAAPAPAASTAVLRSRDHKTEHYLEMTRNREIATTEFVKTCVACFETRNARCTGTRRKIHRSSEVDPVSKAKGFRVPNGGSAVSSHSALVLACFSSMVFSLKDGPTSKVSLFDSTHCVPCSMECIRVVYTSRLFIHPSADRKHVVAFTRVKIYNIYLPAPLLLLRISTRTVLTAKNEQGYYCRVSVGCAPPLTQEGISLSLARALSVCPSVYCRYSYYTHPAWYLYAVRLLVLHQPHNVATCRGRRT